MSLSDGHATIYCVYFLHEPQYIVSTLAVAAVSCVYLADRAQAAGQDRGQDARGGQRAQLRQVPRTATHGSAGQAETAQGQPTRPRWTDGQGDSRTAHTGRTGAHRGRQGQRAGQAAEVDRDSVRRSQRATGRADALTMATVAAGHRKAPGQLRSGHRGGRGAGSIVGVGVGIFAGVIGIIASVAGVAVLDRANRLRALQDLACQIKHNTAVGLIRDQLGRGDL